MLCTHTRSLWDTLLQTSWSRILYFYSPFEININSSNYIQMLPALKNTWSMHIQPYANCSIRHTIKFFRCKWNDVVDVNVNFSVLSFLHDLIFSVKRKHAHIRYSNVYNSTSPVSKSCWFTFSNETWIMWQVGQDYAN